MDPVGVALEQAMHWLQVAIDELAAQSPAVQAMTGAGLLLGIYLVASFVFWVNKPVSDPGGPRKRSEGLLYRRPEWAPLSERPQPIPPLDPRICCVTGPDSHRATGEALLTGEAAGRQLWVLSSEVPSSRVATQSPRQRRAAARRNHGADTAADTDDEVSFDPSVNPNASDTLFRSALVRAWDGKQPELGSRPRTPQAAARRGAEYLQMLQCADGHWGGDYGGPMFLLPGLVIALYVTGQLEEQLPAWKRTAIQRYLLLHQQRDGGWGTHIESPSTMMGSTLSYVVLRLLGMGAEEPALRLAREFLNSQGGALYAASWGKFWMAVLGVYDWRGVNSIPVEMWLLPDWFPFHPGRLWCHCRMVYLPMGYLYSKRFVYHGAQPGPAGACADPLIQQLRGELYPTGTDFASIHWSRFRHTVAAIDNYSPVTLLMRLAQDALDWYEWLGLPRVLGRHSGLAKAIDYIHAEDIQTNFIDIGPVNKAMNMVAVFCDAGGDVDPRLGQGCEAFQRHLPRLGDYLWVSEDGMKMQGYNGSQLWDSSFAVQAFAAAGLTAEQDFGRTMRRAYHFLERSQILSTDTSRATQACQYEQPRLRAKYYRHQSQGGWPFSTSAHGWPITDCTAEGLKGALALLAESPTVQGAVAAGELEAFTAQRLHDAVDVILSMQNGDHGWATYELNRGWGWFEALNPSEAFGDIMIDYSYVECSAASMTALAAHRRHDPAYRSEAVARSIRDGRRFLLSIQRADGSWYGSWGCCFTYGTMFGLQGLAAAGASFASSEPARRACQFLLDKQLANGAWGEDFSSCHNKAYAEHGAEVYGDEEGGAIVQTAWALLGLAAAECPRHDAMRRGAEYLMQRQLANGDWPQEGITGVFNRSCGISYTQYRNIFPVWALGAVARALAGRPQH